MSASVYMLQDEVSQLRLENQLPRQQLEGAAVADEPDARDTIVDLAAAYADEAPLGEPFVVEPAHWVAFTVDDREVLRIGPDPEKPFFVEGRPVPRDDLAIHDKTVLEALAAWAKRQMG